MDNLENSSDMKNNHFQQNTRAPMNHDEAFKKLLLTFFKEFIELFFPQLDQLLDHSQTRFLMQELLVDVVGEHARTLDLLLETKYKASDAWILIHFEPQSYREPHFHERMFIYFSRLFERHRNEHRLIIPIAIFTGEHMENSTNVFKMSLPDQPILEFHFMKVELRNQNWRKFIHSDNPVAAALLAAMGYNKKERRELRLEYMRMLFRLSRRLDDARISLIMSIADMHFKPDKHEDQILLEELQNHYKEEGEIMMELMPAWKKWAYEEGHEEGLEKGIEKGQTDVIRKFLLKGFSPEVIAETTGIPVDKVRELAKP